MFTYVDKARVAYVHKATLGQGIRGGRVTAWEARADARHVGFYVTKRDAIASLRKHLSN